MRRKSAKKEKKKIVAKKSRQIPGGLFRKNLEIQDRTYGESSLYSFLRNFVRKAGYELMLNPGFVLPYKGDGTPSYLFRAPDSATAERVGYPKSSLGEVPFLPSNRLVLEGLMRFEKNAPRTLVSSIYRGLSLLVDHELAHVSEIRDGQGRLLRKATSASAFRPEERAVSQAILRKIKIDYGIRDINAPKSQQIISDILSDMLFTQVLGSQFLPRNRERRFSVPGSETLPGIIDYYFGWLSESLVSKIHEKLKAKLGGAKKFI